MYEVNLLDIDKNERFTKIFYDHEQLRKFIRKVSYSKKIKLLSIENNSYLFD